MVNKQVIQQVSKDKQFREYKGESKNSEKNDTEVCGVAMQSLFFLTKKYIYKINFKPLTTGECKGHSIMYKIRNVVREKEKINVSFQKRNKRKEHRNKGRKRRGGESPHNAHTTLIRNYLATQDYAKGKQTFHPDYLHHIQSFKKKIKQNFSCFLLFFFLLEHKKKHGILYICLGTLTKFLFFRHKLQTLGKIWKEDKMLIKTSGGG